MGHVGTFETLYATDAYQTRLAEEAKEEKGSPPAPPELLAGPVRAGPEGIGGPERERRSRRLAALVGPPWGEARGLGSKGDLRPASAAYNNRVPPPLASLAPVKHGPRTYRVRRQYRCGRAEPAGDHARGGPRRHPRNVIGHRRRRTWFGCAGVLGLDCSRRTFVQVHRCAVSPFTFTKRLIPSRGAVR